jgi:ribosomal protein L7Ae-like RNA K-turn-binding protein
MTLAPMTVEALEGLIRERVSRKVAALLGLARRARKVASGTEAVESAVKRHSAQLILSAADASVNSVEKLRSLAAQIGVTWKQALDKEELGAALGGAPRACVAVTDPHFAGAVLSVLEKIPMEMDTREAAGQATDLGGRAEPRKVWG